MKPERYAELRSQEQILAPLRDDPSFLALRQLAEQQESKFWHDFTEKAKRGQPIDPAEVEIERRAFRKARAWLGEPYEVERKLQQEIAKQGG